MSDNREERWQDLDLAAAIVSRAGTLVGLTIAVFSFLLFFLYPRYSSGQSDAVLFQVTLTIIVLSILTFSLSGLFYYRIGVLRLNTAKKRASMQRGAGLTVVGIVALIAWLLVRLRHSARCHCLRKSVRFLTVGIGHETGNSR